MRLNLPHGGARSLSFVFCKVFIACKQLTSAACAQTGAIVKSFQQSAQNKVKRADFEPKRQIAAILRLL